MRNTVGPLSARSAEDRAYAAVPQSLVNVGKPVGIRAGQKMAICVENMIPYFDVETPTLQHLGAIHHLASLGCTRRRNKPHSITRPQPRGLQYVLLIR